MKIYALTFSPTGATQQAAELLCEAWGVMPESIDLMTQTGPLFFSEHDLCVIAVPVYGGRVPEAALRNLRMMKGNGCLAVLVAVYGNRAVDDALLELRDETWACGFHCVAAVAAVGEHSMFRQFGAGRPDAKDEEELAQLAKRIDEKLEAGDFSEPAHIPGRRPYQAFGGVPLHPKATSRCDRCGLCARECPMQAIPREDPRKVDKRRCITCMHCVSVCPQQARRLKGLVSKIAVRTLRAACAERKPNVLYL